MSKELVEFDRGGADSVGIRDLSPMKVVRKWYFGCIHAALRGLREALQEVAPGFRHTAP